MCENRKSSERVKAWSHLDSLLARSRKRPEIEEDYQIGLLKRTMPPFGFF